MNPISTPVIAYPVVAKVVYARIVHFGDEPNNDEPTGPDAIFIFYEDLLNTITNIRLPLHLGA